jgi:hypothetical protein
MMERRCRIEALKPLMPHFVLGSLALGRNLFCLELPNTFDAVRRFVRTPKFLMGSILSPMESILFRKTRAIIQKSSPDTAR